MVRRWLNETAHTLSVITFHPLGWGLAKVRRKVPEITPFDSPAHEAPVILVHGVFHNASAFFRLEESLRQRGFRLVRTIELWTSLESLSGLIAQLREEVLRMHRLRLIQGQSRKVRLVAHSLGGMVVRAALLDPAFTQLIDQVIFLGVPHQGNIFYRLPFPRCLRDLHDTSPVMRRLRAEPLPPGVDYWNLRGGPLDIVTPRANTFLPHVHNVTFERIGHAGLLADRQVIESVTSILESSPL